ncbi:TspO/MBR family protein [Culicoidibacter larvae]|uniref:Tryptophan-rich sensory protein n=1 Tax=Culicoidibacter larvae TaxID=2579976 RepID=A0A5R8QE34_9FIRM|nr:TspO/MBR family protein [Culicoidibacter larvae]TLG75448.1 tryptophan-rich sensory protein [Culicoidibacter larvae]
MKVVKDWRLWASIIIVTLLGLLSGIFSINAGEYYKSLILPVFAPPAWLFGPVWIILYILMGITFYFILTHADMQQRKIMLSMFIAQFILNFIWSGLFFTLQNNLLSVIDITLLWILLFIQQAFYSKYKPVAMWLMGPYFLWVTFASVLNYAILFLN